MSVNDGNKVCVFGVLKIKMHVRNAYHFVI